MKFQMFNTEEFMSNSGENYKYKIKMVIKLKKCIICLKDWNLITLGFQS